MDPLNPVTPVRHPTEVSKDVQKLYQVIQKYSGAVGGYGHNGPVYGEITMGTLQKVLNFLRDNLDFGSHSSFLDIGSGLGKPNLHVAVDPGVHVSFGIELEELRWQLSMHNLRFAIQEAAVPDSVVYFAHNDATQIVRFEPFTHIYMFDVGFPPAALVSIANAFNVSRSVKALVSFTRPLYIIDTYGFAVECIGKVQTRMHGSSEGHMAYIYRALHNQLSDPRLELAPAVSPRKRKRSSPTKPRPRQMDFATAAPDQLIASGLGYLVQPSPEQPSPYSLWVQHSGKLGSPGAEQGRPVRTMKARRRLLFGS